MNYNYYKDKYKTISIKLDRQREADIISLLEGAPDGPKAFIINAVKFYVNFVSSIALGGVKHGK